MHYGLTLPNMGGSGDVRTLADLAQLAEGARWDGFFLWDALNYDADNVPVADTWIALAAIAMQTKQIKIGTMVATPTRRRPWKMAREDEQAKATIRAYANAGATWCLANVGTEKDLDGLRASIQ